MKSFEKKTNQCGNAKFFALLFFISTFVSGCNTRMQFKQLPEPEAPFSSDVLYENFFPVNLSSVSYTQANLEENKTTITFQVQNPLGQFDSPLKESDLKLVENNKEVEKFVLTKNSTTTAQTVDILFAIDVTGSMAPTIEAAKTRIINFINHSREMGYHTRMCLSTFGDFTITKCTRFYDNDPNDPATQTQVAELISEITKLKALTGQNDPGGTDLDENPMRALIDAASAPWISDSQRFTILVTDAGFLYSPGNSGAVGKLAPEYKEVMTALEQSKMKIFAATPSLAGYNKKFGKYEGIVTLSQGEWFKYADLVNGTITMNTILNKILTSVNTTFFLNYTLNSQSPQDPSLPLSQRQISLQLKDPALGTLLPPTITSNLPNGREKDQTDYKVSDKKIKADSLQVWVDNVLLESGYSYKENGELHFENVQKGDAKIRIQYEYADLKDSVALQPVVIIVSKKTKTQRLVLSINGIEMSSDHYEMISTDDGKVSVNFKTDIIFSEQDPYEIDLNRGMEVQVLLNSK